MPSIHQVVLIVIRVRRSRCVKHREIVFKDRFNTTDLSSWPDVVDHNRLALFSGVKNLEIVSTSRPKPSHDQVVVQVERAGICGSDLHSYRGHSLRGRFDEWQKLGLADGHEFSGQVVEKGEGVLDLELGDFVTSEAVWHCGECSFCQSGPTTFV